MPPKGRGRPPKQQSGQNNGSQNASGTSNLVDAAKAPSTMSGKRSASNGKRKGKAPSSRNAIPEVYQEMLAEALPNRAEKPERPLKKRRIGPRENQVATSGSANLSDEEDEDDLQFEDVIAANDFDSDAPPKIQQTAYKDSDDESEGDDFDWEGVDFDANLDPGEPSGDLELTLTTKATPQSRKVTQRRKVVSKAERVARLEIHKMHVLCLLSHLDRRNEWCNDSDVHASLKPLLDKKMLTFLSPRPDLSQFSRADSLKRGLEQVSVMWRTKFSITARGMRRALWADDERELQNVSDNFLTYFIDTN
jgi:xeroderma pigmentosum group C-complementing protein